MQDPTGNVTDLGCAQFYISTTEFEVNWRNPGKIYESRSPIAGNMLSS